jgi:nickel-dependent lactate racemase
MKPDLNSALKNTKVNDWKKIKVEFSGRPLSVYMPRDSSTLTMGKTEILKDPAKKIREAIENPLGDLCWGKIIQGKGKPADQLQVAITVSDITRPVPYKGKNGILLPLLRKLQTLGVRPKNIRLIVGTGTHRASTFREKVEMLGKEIVAAYEVQDHDCEDRANLVFVGKTSGGSEVFLNKSFAKADLKIVTGLTESHFMAGASGGRKAICPGLVDLRTIQKFHSPEFLESPKATNLILEGNPCHEEAARIARTVGVDFSITVTLDQDLHLTGIFAGELEIILQEALRKIQAYVSIAVPEEFDIVVTHGGYVGRNHYQTAKAAVGALPAVKSKGVIIIAADNQDQEPIGGPEYRSLIHLLKLQGVDGYLQLLQSPTWKFTKDQWEPEIWGRVLRKVGEEGIIYCSADIPEEDFSNLPGFSGYHFLTSPGRKKSRARKVQEMVQNAIVYFYHHYAAQGIAPRMAFIREGPYAVPLKTGDRVTNSETNRSEKGHAHGTL